MPDTVYALRPLTKTGAEVVPALVDFTALLATSETLSGSPTVTVSPVGPTIGSATVNSSALTPRDGEGAVAIGKGVQFTISGGASKQRYELTISCSTTVSGRTVGGKCVLLVDV